MFSERDSEYTFSSFCKISFLHFFFRRCFSLAYELRQRPHRAIDAPRARTEPEHRGKRDDFRRQHEAVELKGERSHPRLHAACIRPLPRNAHAPKNRDDLGKASRAMRDEPGRVDDIPEHRKEKHHERIAERLPLHPGRHRAPA